MFCYVGLALLNIRAISLNYPKRWISSPLYLFQRRNYKYSADEERHCILRMKLPIPTKKLYSDSIMRSAPNKTVKLLQIQLCHVQSGQTHSCFRQDLVRFQLFFPQGSVLGSVPSAQWIHKRHEKGSMVRWQCLLMILSYSQQQRQ